MVLLHGITVNLYNIDRTGKDPFNRPIETWTEAIPVDNVIVGLPTAEEITNTLNIHGKQVAYTLGIPKGDNHTWEGEVEFFGNRYKIITAPTQGIEDMIPLSWNKKVLVEAYPAPEV